MRVLHAGNIANNGYLNAKFQRRAGIEADALCDELHALSQPEWEDAPLDGQFEPYGALREAAGRNGWSRPPWVLEADDPLTQRRFRGHHFLEDRLRVHLLGLWRLRARRAELRRDYEPLRDLLGGELRHYDVDRVSVWIEHFGRYWRGAARLFRSYDVVQAYATYPILVLVAAPGHPYVAFEHGTMRDIPFEDSFRGRLLSLAYRKAAKVVITNPDVIAAARRLGLDNYVFIPHPIDETKYMPGESDFRRRHALGDGTLLLSPSSQTWEIKGNDRLLRGFAEYARRDPGATLVLTEWGPDIERSRSLAADLGVGERIRWLPPLPKLQLIAAYRASDVVLDQFLIGTFGAVAPEAMSCGRPVVMAFDEDVHRWCLPEPPPIVAAREPAEIALALERLADRDERERLGAASRDWVVREHGSALVVERHRAVYEEILAARAPVG